MNHPFLKIGFLLFFLFCVLDETSIYIIKFDKKYTYDKKTFKLYDRFIFSKQMRYKHDLIHIYVIMYTYFWQQINPSLKLNFFIIYILKYKSIST